MDNRKWIGERLWYLLNLQKKDLEIVFPHHKWISLKNKRKLYRRKIRLEEIPMPRKPEQYQPTDTPEMIRDRLAEGLGKTAVEQVIDEQTREKLHTQLDSVIDQTNINPALIKGFRASTWESLTKNADGEAEIHKLSGIQLVAEAKDLTPKWDVVKRVESVKLPKKESLKQKGAKKAVILSDLQIPYQDADAVDVALQIIQDSKPDKVILVGDMLDLAAWGKYQQRPEFAHQTQQAVIDAHTILATIRKMCPRANIVVLAGNHENRLENNILANTAEAYGLKRADDLTGYPVMSVPYLCAFDQLDVEYVGGYPANRYWVNDNLQVRHGQRVKSSGSTAKLVADDERVSTIFGHVHRVETHFKTVNVRDGGRTNAAYSIGCLCLINGSVPSTKNGYDISGKPVENYEDWQNAIAVVSYEDGDGPFNVEPVYINSFNKHRAVHNGKVYETRRKEDGDK